MSAMLLFISGSEMEYGGTTGSLNKKDTKTALIDNLWPPKMKITNVVKIGFNCFEAFYILLYKLLGVECRAKSAPPAPENFCTKFATPPQIFRTKSATPSWIFLELSFIEYTSTQCCLLGYSLRVKWQNTKSLQIMLTLFFLSWCELRLNSVMMTYALFE